MGTNALHVASWWIKKKNKTKATTIARSNGSNFLASLFLASIIVLCATYIYIASIRSISLHTQSVFQLRNMVSAMPRIGVHTICNMKEWIMIFIFPHLIPIIDFKLLRNEFCLFKNVLSVVDGVGFLFSTERDALISIYCVRQCAWSRWMNYVVNHDSSIFVCTLIC